MSTPAEIAAAALAQGEALAVAEAKIETAHAAVEAREAAVAPTVVAPETPIEPGKTRGDLQRDEIYARAAANRLRPGDESAEAMRQGAQQLMSDGDGQPIEPVEITNPQQVVADPVTPVQQPVAPTAVATPAPAPLAKPADMVTIRVDGREIAVPAADVIRAGVATLQKETTADIRLQRVSLAEQQLILDRQALDRRAAEISGAPTPPGGAPPANTGPLSTDGQPAADAGVKKALEALLDSDTDTAARGLSQLVANEVAKRMQAAAPGQQPASPAAIPSPWSKDDVAKANQLVDLVFADVRAVPAAKEEFTRRIVEEMQNPMNRIGRTDLNKIAVLVGNEVRERFSMPVHRLPPANSVADELHARRTLAARIPQVPQSGAPRTAPSTGPAAPARQKGADIVAGMRKARGQDV